MGAQRSCNGRKDLLKIGSKLLVVVADDEPAIVDLVRLILEDSGYEVLGAVGGLAAVTALQSNPDAFVLDVLMPDLDGVNCVEQIRAAGFNGPILVMTTLRSTVLRDDLATRLDAQMIDKIKELGQILQLLGLRWGR